MFPRWMSWIFLAFFAYMIYLGNFSTLRHKTPEPAKETSGSAQKYPKLAEVSDVSRWKRALNPDYIGPARWREVKEGEGEGAVCGESVKVKITGIAPKEETRRVHIGNAPYAVLDTALIGIRPGGVREISAPPDKVYKKPAKDQKRMVDFTVERLADTPSSKQEPAK